MHNSFHAALAMQQIRLMFGRLTYPQYPCPGASLNYNASHTFTSQLQM